MIPCNFQLSTLNFQLSGGAYCIKRFFQIQKTSETKQMLIYFSAVKKGLFPMIRDLTSAKRDFIALIRNFVALKSDFI